MKELETRERKPGEPAGTHGRAGERAPLPVRGRGAAGPDALSKAEDELRRARELLERARRAQRER